MRAKASVTVKGRLCESSELTEATVVEELLLNRGPQGALSREAAVVPAEVPCWLSMLPATHWVHSEDFGSLNVYGVNKSFCG